MNKEQIKQKVLDEYKFDEYEDETEFDVPSPNQLVELFNRRLKDAISLAISETEKAKDEEWKPLIFSLEERQKAYDKVRQATAKAIFERIEKMNKHVDSAGWIQFGCPFKDWQSLKKEFGVE